MYRCARRMGACWPAIARQACPCRRSTTRPWMATPCGMPISRPPARQNCRCADASRPGRMPDQAPCRAWRCASSPARPCRGTDTVFMQEDVRIEGDGVVLPPGLKPGANRRFAGEDLPIGEIALPAGRRLRPQDVALAAAQGWTHLPVRRRLRVALISTGDELTEPGTPCRPPASTIPTVRCLPRC